MAKDILSIPKQFSSFLKKIIVNIKSVSNYQAHIVGKPSQCKNVFFSIPAVHVVIYIFLKCKQCPQR